jgi:glucose/arabinose dehydrogenase
MRPLLMLLCVAATPVMAQKAVSSCGVYPALAVTTPVGTCVAVIASAKDGLKFPRKMIEVSPGRYWATDMGSWEKSRGRLLEVRPDFTTGKTLVTVLAEPLDRPHGLLLAPDGLVYVGEAGVLWRVNPKLVANAAQLSAVKQVIAKDLADNGAHPLKELAASAADAQGAFQLYFNQGSATDACRNDAQQQPKPCLELTGTQPRAAVYEMTVSTGKAPGPAQVFAHGLRNSMGLTVAPGANAVLQAENSVDYVDAKLPQEELNVLQRGQRYGWPYCVGASTPARGYDEAALCKDQRKPAQLLPAHTAPLGLAVAPANAVARLGGKLVMSYHGYRPGGHQIVSVALSSAGLPVGKPQPVVHGWDARGNQPLGAPVGISFDGAGRLLTTEDRNKTLLMLMNTSP